MTSNAQDCLSSTENMTTDEGTICKGMNIEGSNATTVVAPVMYEGCSIRGLPIGVPFRATITAPAGKESDFKDVKSVFIITQLKNMQAGQEIINIMPNEEKCRPVRESLATTVASNNEVNVNLHTTGVDHNPDLSDVDSVTLEDQLSGSDSELPLEMNCVSTASTLSNLTRQKLKEKLKVSSKAVEKLNNDIISDKKTKKRKKRTTGKTSETDSGVNIDFHPKIKKIEITDDNNDKNRRRSSRQSFRGYRPDYQAIDEFSGDTINSDSDIDYDSTEYNTKYNNIDDNMYLLKSRHSVEADDNADTAEANENVDIKPSIKELKKVMTNLKTNTTVKKKKPRIGPKSKIKKVASNDDTDDIIKPKVKEEDPDFKPKVNLKSEGDNKIRKPRGRKRKLKAENATDVGGSVNTDTESSSSVKRRPGRPRQDPELRQLKKIEARKKARDRYRAIVARQEKKENEINGVDENGEKVPTTVDRLKLQKAVAKQEKLAKRIRVKLQDHPDMYRMDFMESYERRNRGKSVIETGLELYVCTLCEKYKTDNKESLEMHLELHVNGELTCDKCGWVGSYVGELLKHKRDIHKKNVWICDECGVECSGHDGLKDHIGKEHDRPQYPCKHCEEKGEKVALLTLNLFRKHLRTDHPDKLILCKGCKRLFATKGQLTRHLSIGCEGDGPKEYPCDKCGKIFTSSHGVQRHIDRVHHKVRSFPCPKCSFTAARPSGLNQHLLVHAGYHPNKCDQCSFSCVQKYQLKSHMRTHTGEKPYKCSDCNYAAAWKVQLKEHMKIHNVSNTVYCNDCGLLFRDYRSYKAHQSKEHGAGGSSRPAEREEGPPAPAHQPEPYHQVQPFPEDLSLAQHFPTMPYFQPYN